MITNANVTALFAENVRQEVSGQHTLVGIFEDIAEFPSLPVNLHQLAILTTISTLINDPFTPKLFRVKLSSGDIVMSHDFPEDFEAHQVEAIKKRTDDGDSAWIYLRLVIGIAGVQATEDTKIFVELEGSDGAVVKSNSLTFKAKRQATTIVPEERNKGS